MANKTIIQSQFKLFKFQKQQMVQVGFSQSSDPICRSLNVILCCKIMLKFAVLHPNLPKQNELQFRFGSQDTVLLIVR